MIKKLLFFPLLFATQLAFAATAYYVDPVAGSDGFVGDAGNPFLTVAHCASVATTPGDSCNLVTSQYSEHTITINAASGTAETSKDVENITKASPPVATVTNHGYSNGDIVVMQSTLGVYMQGGMTQPIDQWFKVANATTNTFEMYDLDNTNGWDGTAWDEFNGGTVVRRIQPIIFKSVSPLGAVFDPSISISTWTLTGTANVWVSENLASMSGTGVYLWRVGSGVLLQKRESSLASVDTQDDYFWDSSAKFMYVYSTTNPNLATWKVNYKSIFTIKNRGWVLFDGIDMQYATPGLTIGDGSTTTTASTSNIMVRKVRAQFMDALGGITVTSAAQNVTRNVTIDQSEIAWVNDVASGSNGHAIKFAANTDLVDGRYATISRCTLHDFRYQGTQFSNGWAYPHFWGNRIYSIAPQNSGGGAGIRFGHPSDVVGHTYGLAYDNNIGNGSGGTGNSVNTGFYIQEDSNEIRAYRNYIHDNDWHAYYVFSVTPGREPYNIWLFDNLNVRNRTSTFRIEESDSVFIFNNSGYDNGYLNSTSTNADLSLNDNSPADGSAQGVVYQNNICSNVTASCIGALSGITITSDFNVLYTAGTNLVTIGGVTYTDFASYKAAVGSNDQHSIGADPQYTNPPTNLTLQVGSPARAAGKDLSIYGAFFTKDYTKKERRYIWDIGAYEPSDEVLADGVRIGS